jgi:hypothetical protein
MVAISIPVAVTAITDLLSILKNLTGMMVTVMPYVETLIAVTKSRNPLGSTVPKNVAKSLQDGIWQIFIGVE